MRRERERGGGTASAASTLAATSTSEGVPSVVAVQIPGGKLRHVAVVVALHLPVEDYGLFFQ